MNASTAERRWSLSWISDVLRGEADGAARQPLDFS
jgi:hypothetical protein